MCCGHSRINVVEAPVFYYVTMTSIRVIPRAGPVIFLIVSFGSSVPHPYPIMCYMFVISSCAIHSSFSFVPNSALSLALFSYTVIFTPCLYVVACVSLFLSVRRYIYVRSCQLFDVLVAYALVLFAKYRTQNVVLSVFYCP